MRARAVAMEQQRLRFALQRHRRVFLGVAFELLQGWTSLQRGVCLRVLLCSLRQAPCLYTPCFVRAVVDP